MNRLNLFVTTLLVIQFIGVINGMIFFFIIAKVNFKDWIFLNSCSSSSILLVIGYIMKFSIKNNSVLYISIALIFYFGCYGLYKSTWKGAAMVTQIVHISMVLNAVAILYGALINKDLEVLLVSLIIGIIMVVLYKITQKRYFKLRLETLKKNPVLSNNL